MPSDAVSVLAAVSLPVIGGTISARYAMSRPSASRPSESRPSESREHYNELIKPSYAPPSWVYGIVWTALYVMMGLASYRVYKAGGGMVAAGLYALQLGLNMSWSPVFFRSRDRKGAAVIAVALCIAVAATAASFARYDRTAAMLMMPYLAWTIFAAVLSLDIWVRNNRTNVNRTNPR
jgi:translocator protein